MWLVWTLTGHGFASCGVGDEHGEAEIEASYITRAPEDLLTAVARVVAGIPEAEALCNAEPVEYRWSFALDGADVVVRLAFLDGPELWSSRQPVERLARVVVRCFDDVARRYGEDGYRELWRSEFPRLELAALRRVWRRP